MTTTSSKPEMLLWLDDHRGMYIPRDFANSFANRAAAVQGVDNETWAILENGPDDEWYWEAWDDVCGHAIITDGAGVQYRIYQDGDCWLVPVDMEWNDETGTFEWPK